jgi:catechol 2,3-dioxygenase-like lactoylglutathione lyase family enzyme
MNHFTIVTLDLDKTKRFYMDVLGLTEGFRPDFGFDGAWLYCGPEAVLHVMALGHVPEDPAGALDHMAFSAQDLPGVCRKLKSRGIEYDLRKQNTTGTWQMFFYDPNGAKVELDFAAHETND